MGNTVRNKRGSGSDPSASDLVLGEIAVRTDTGQLFVKKDNGSVASIAGGISDGDKGDITVSNSGATFTIDSGVIDNANIASNAAIAGSKITPTFTSNIQIQNENPEILLVDTGDNPNFKIENVDGLLALRDTTNSTNRLTINSSGVVDIAGNLDVGSGLDVTGSIISSKDGNQGTQGNAALVLTHATNSNLRANHLIVDDFPSGSGTYFIQATESGVSNDRNMCLQGYGGKLKIGSNSVAPTELLDVAGNIAVSGTVDGRDLATDGSKLDGIASGATNVSTENIQDIVGGMVTGNTESGITVTYQDSDGTLDFAVASQTDNNFTTTLKNKLDGIASGATNVTNTNQLTNGAGFITATLTNEQVQDIVGGMVSGNTETGITVTYQDSDGTLDFAVASQTDNNFTTTLKNKLDGIAASATNVTNNNQISNGAGYVTSSVINSLNASNLSSGTIPDARFPSTLPAVSGANLTGISATVAGGAIYENAQTISSNYTITNGKNAMSAGPITINSGVTVTVGSGETYTIV